MHAAGYSQDRVKDSQVWTITIQISLTLKVTSATVNLKKKNYGLRKNLQIKAMNKAEWNGTANIPVPENTTNVQ